MSETVGKNIKNIREQKNISIKQLADIISVDSKIVSAWEIGDKIPSVGDIKKLVVALDTTKEILLSSDQDETTKLIEDNPCGEHHSIHIYNLKYLYITFFKLLLYRKKFTIISIFIMGLLSFKIVEDMENTVSVSNLLNFSFIFSILGYLLLLVVIMILCMAIIHSIQYKKEISYFITSNSIIYKGNEYAFNTLVHQIKCREYIFLKFPNTWILIKSNDAFESDKLISLYSMSIQNVLLLIYTSIWTLSLIILCRYQFHYAKLGYEFIYPEFGMSMIVLAIISSIGIMLYNTKIYTISKLKIFYNILYVLPFFIAMILQSASPDRVIQGFSPDASHHIVLKYNKNNYSTRYYENTTSLYCRYDGYRISYGTKDVNFDWINKDLCIMEFINQNDEKKMVVANFNKKTDSRVVNESIIFGEWNIADAPADDYVLSIRPNSEGSIDTEIHSVLIKNNNRCEEYTIEKNINIFYLSKNKMSIGIYDDNTLLYIITLDDTKMVLRDISKNEDNHLTLQKNNRAIYEDNNINRYLTVEKMIERMDKVIADDSRLDRYYGTYLTKAIYTDNENMYEVSKLALEKFKEINDVYNSDTQILNISILAGDSNAFYVNIYTKETHYDKASGQNIFTGNMFYKYRIKKAEGAYLISWVENNDIGSQDLPIIKEENTLQTKDLPAYTITIK